MAESLPPDFQMPDELPVLPLREFVVFPYMVLPLFLTRERSVAAVEDALAADRLLLLAAQRNPEIEEPEARRPAPRRHRRDGDAHRCACPTAA